MFRGSLLPPSAGQRTGQLHNATIYCAVTERDITGLFIRVQRRVGWGVLRFQKFWNSNMNKRNAAVLKDSVCCLLFYRKIKTYNKF